MTKMTTPTRMIGIRNPSKTISVELELTIMGTRTPMTKTITSIAAETTRYPLNNLPNGSSFLLKKITEAYK